MAASRLALALESGLSLPGDGPIAVLGPPAGFDLSALDRSRLRIAARFRPDHDHFDTLGYVVARDVAGPVDHALVVLPRAKALARAHVAAAARIAPGGTLIVDGQKTDGVDGVLRDIRKRVPLDGLLSKAHGKIAWLRPGDALAGWEADEAPRSVDGFVTAPGVFSADGPDPASVLLADALPDLSGKRVVDLGAGWGYLSARILAAGTPAALDLVEADAAALECARRNAAGAAVAYHWADARLWTPGAPADVVVSNPPFHTGRAGDPGLGQGFIEAARRALAPSGRFWMVANRHLPYEAALRSAFGEVQEIGADPKFKIFRAARPARRTPQERTP